jgi:hypothetical protein
MEAKAQKSTEIALEAVEKESKFEQLAIEEELMREREEENKLNKAIEDEEEKKVWRLISFFNFFNFFILICF